MRLHLFTCFFRNGLYLSIRICATVVNQQRALPIASFERKESPSLLGLGVTASSWWCRIMCLVTSPEIFCIIMAFTVFITSILVYFCFLKFHTQSIFCRHVFISSISTFQNRSFWWTLTRNSFGSSVRGFIRQGPSADWGIFLRAVAPPSPDEVSAGSWLSPDGVLAGVLIRS